jgi:trans-aconitate 2-methyltransferase
MWRWKVTAEIASYLKNGCVLGLDSSREMIELAKKKFPYKDYSNLTFQIRDVRELEYNEKFDLVFSNAALHWIKNHIIVLKTIQRSLKLGGRVLIQMGGQGNARDVIKVVDEIIIEKKWSYYFKDFEFPYGFYGPDEYREWLKEANLQPLRVELKSKVMIQKGIDGLKAWIRTTWLPYTQRIPKKLQEDFVDEIVGRYLKNNPLNDGGLVRVDMMRLEVEAIKK